MRADRAPRLGDTVIHRTQEKSLQHNNCPDHPALVTRVWNAGMVNLHVLPDFGPPRCEGSQQLIDPEDKSATGWYFEQLPVA